MMQGRRPRAPPRPPSLRTWPLANDPARERIRRAQDPRQSGAAVSPDLVLDRLGHGAQVDREMRGCRTGGRPGNEPKG